MGLGTVMPSDKSTGKPSWKLFFSEALAQQHPGLHQQQPPVADATDTHLGTEPDSMMEHILQKFAAVGKRLDDMDTRISELTSESRSLCTYMAKFQDRVMGLDQRLTLVEDKLNQPMAKDQELQYLRNKLMDLEDRSRRDNVYFFGILE
ncbi:hypothetical protein NDU88_005193 [Pleurodeles waltl]|uniref:Uncharacterized protein n=1 Tax=Pleurodeles waltl TaxID=8319 RepID=A0AAV7TTB0_PLEWA|nr:hypothetical protein NDU88_005193 [Pleurodeles waltl]